ncbi:hypothetical protein BX070DRAFT_230436 [Coemansia spiralis]|nr:hypothetical protein BX070DRAFT_230436 [Coemansia spiralis]
MASPQNQPLMLSKAPTTTRIKLGQFSEPSEQDAGHQQTSSNTAYHSGCFPVRICNVPGRGRGYFAARSIAKGETVLRAAPLAWAISEDWIKNTCWWCFVYDPRKTHQVKAVEGPAALLASAPNHNQNKKTSSSQFAQYKGVFCSPICQQKAVLAHGGPDRWKCYLALLGAIESEVRATKSKQGRAVSKTTSEHTQISSKDTIQYVAVADTNISTFSAPAAATPKVACMSDFSRDIDFDPDDMSDEQLSDWISYVWDIITVHSLFQNNLPDSSQRELVRLICNALFLQDNATTTEPTSYSDSWQILVVSRDATEDNAMPLHALAHVRNNEVDFLRAKLHQLQLETLQTPATVAPIRLPLQPTPTQIEQSHWGAAAFKTAASAYALLEKAWKHTSKSQDNALCHFSHEQFRSVYFREMANSFGIWEVTEDDIGQQPQAQLKSAESEWLGFSIYPTAVYFNHSCAPNIRKVRTARMMSFISCRDIEQGEELFITYGSVAEAAPLRRSRLQQNFFFECVCDRCLAETSQCQILALNTLDLLN